MSPPYRIPGDISVSRRWGSRAARNPMPHARAMEGPWAGAAASLGIECQGTDYPLALEGGVRQMIFLVESAG